MATILKAGNVASGAQITSDSTGILEIKTGTGSGTTAITVGTNQAVTIGGNNISAVNSLGFRNRIINGDMRIDQRNAGASVTINSNAATYTVDRFFAQGQSTDGVFTVQRSTTAPTGFVNSLQITVTTADSSIGASQIYQLVQPIEGFNVADLGWGAAGAQSVTLSFWVRSSLTGTFGGALSNQSLNRSYPFTYTINSANTFELKTITITGDTTGTWGTGNGVGIYVIWGIGVGSTYTGTAGSWAGSDFRSATGSTNVIATNGATFYITGVQLEAGSVATPFERRDYGRELAMCQRYYYRISSGAANGYFSTGGQWYGSTSGAVTTPFPVTMRTRPTALEQSGTASHYAMISNAGGAIACSAVPTFQGDTTTYLAVTNFTTASGGTAGYTTNMYSNNASAYLGWSAEL
jgi:hypothetical protein